MRYAVDLRHPLQPPCGGYGSSCRKRRDIYPVVEAVGVWESRRDFQREWEGWEAGFMAFHPFHSLSLPWPAFRVAVSSNAARSMKAEFFRVQLSDLQITEVDTVKSRVNELEAQLLKPEYFADEDPGFVPADVATVVDTSQ